jgi:HlyD family secretion protein
VVLAALVGCSGNDNKDRVGVARIQDLEQRITVSGTLRGKRSAYITPSYIGYVRDLRVQLGDRVKEGQPLVRISQAIDQPLNQVYPIRSPFAGVVTQVLRREGEFINETSGSTGVTSGSIMRIDDLSEFWLDSAVPETDIAKIKIGLTSVIRPNALVGATYYGSVEQISLSSRESTDRWDRGKVEFPISVRVTNPDDNLRPGMSAVVDIIAAKAEKVLTLEHEFVHRRDNEYFVVDTSGKEIPIEVGLSNESLVQITKGLDQGAKVKMIDFAAVSPSGKSRR